ncbi:MAG: FlgD immunoglobulin-like domain containing protein, partial [Patescibacteria group bacterium]
LPERSTVSLKIYDVQGRLVTVLSSGTKEAGDYKVQWRGTNQQGESVASGVYFCRLQTGGFAQTRKLILLK